MDAAFAQRGSESPRGGTSTRRTCPEVTDIGVRVGMTTAETWCSRNRGRRCSCGCGRTLTRLPSTTRTKSLEVDRLSFWFYEFDGLDAYYATLCLRQPWALGSSRRNRNWWPGRAVDGEFVDEVVVPWPGETIRQQIGQLYQSSFALRRRADRLVEQAIIDVENLIDGKLDEAVCLTEGRTLADEFGLEAP